jgi:hypothetical protein
MNITAILFPTDFSHNNDAASNLAPSVASEGRLDFFIQSPY